MTEKNCFDVTKLIFQITCVTVVQWSRSCLHLQINRVRLPATLFSVSLYGFFSVWSLFNTIFPFGIFFSILTADPAGACTWINIYVKCKSGVYFGKGISKVLDHDLHTGQAYAPINVMPAWGGGGGGKAGHGLGI